MDYGKVTFNGNEVILEDSAWAENYRDGVRYYAHGHIADGRRYRIAWDTTDKWNTHQNNPDHPMHSGVFVWSCDWCDDESNACDWDNPVDMVSV